MSQTVLIEAYNDISEQREVYELPLTEDISPQIESNFESIKDYMGSFLSGILDKVKTTTTATGGYSKQIETLYSVQLWKETKPVTLNMTCSLYVKNSPFDDVFLPYYALTSQCIPSQTFDGSGRFVVPGINLMNYQRAVSEGKTSSPDEAKIVSVEIPGVIYLEKAYVFKAQPTISQYRTESGIPLYIDLDLEIHSIRPAMNMDLMSGKLNNFEDLKSRALLRKREREAENYRRESANREAISSFY